MVGILTRLSIGHLYSEGGSSRFASPSRPRTWPGPRPVPLARRAEDVGVSDPDRRRSPDDQSLPRSQRSWPLADATTTLPGRYARVRQRLPAPGAACAEAATVDQRRPPGVPASAPAGCFHRLHRHRHPARPPSVRIARLEEALEVIRRSGPASRSSTTAASTTSPVWSGRRAWFSSRTRRSSSAAAAAKVLRWPAARGRHLNPSLPAGRSTTGPGRRPPPEATEQKIGWIRAAGDRFDGIELGARIHLAIVTNDRRGDVRRPRRRVRADRRAGRRIAARPVQDLDQIADDLEERREAVRHLGGRPVGVVARRTGTADQPPRRHLTPLAPGVVDTREGRVGAAGRVAAMDADDLLGGLNPAQYGGSADPRRRAGAGKDPRPHAPHRAPHRVHGVSPIEIPPSPSPTRRRER